MMPSQVSAAKFSNKHRVRKLKEKESVSEIRKERKRADPEVFRQARYRQIAEEEAQAQKLRDEGWEVYSPTVVCDRIAIKDGKAYFIEFKRRENQELRPGQKRLSEIAEQQFIIVVYDKAVSSNGKADVS